MRKCGLFVFLVLMIGAFSFCALAAETVTVYVNSTDTAHASSNYTTLEEAVAALPDAGGTVVVCADTSTSADSGLSLPAKDITITAQNDATLTFKRSVYLGGDTVFENIKLVNGVGGRLNIFCCGNSLTVESDVETVTNSKEIFVYAGIDGATTITGGSITLRGGTWTDVHAGSVTSNHTGTVTMLIDGATITGGLVLGNNSDGGHFTGTCNATVKSGSINRLRTKYSTGSTLTAVLNGGTVKSLEMPAVVQPAIGGSVTITTVTSTGSVTAKADDGYEVVVNDTVYTQVDASQVSDTVYVDGVGTDENTYVTLEEAVAALPLSGGTVVVSVDTTTSSATELLLPAKGLKITSQNDAMLTFKRSVKLGADTVFENIKLVNGTGGRLNISCQGHALTVGEGVETDKGGGAIFVYAGTAAESGNSFSGGSITLKSGTWDDVHSGSLKLAHGGEVTMLIDGATITGSLVFGNNTSGGNFTGTCNLTVESGNINRLRTKNSTGTLLTVLHGGTVASLELPATVAPTIGGSVTITTVTSTGSVTTKAVAGYVVIREDTVYKLRAIGDGPAYVDGTGATLGAFATLEEAYALLAETGGSIIVSGDTAFGTDGELTTLPKRSGAVTISGENGAMLTLAGTVVLDGDLVFEDVTLVSAGTLYAGGGNTLTVKDTVLVEGSPLAIELGKDGVAILDINTVNVTAEDGYELVITGNTYTVQPIEGITVGYISNADGNNENDGLTDATPKQNQGQIDGNGLRNLLYGGGYAVLCGDLAVGGNYIWNYGGDVVITGCYGGKDYRDADANTGIFIMPDGTVITVGSEDLTFKNVILRPGADSKIRVISGITLTIDNTVTVLADTLVVEIGWNGTAIVDNDAVIVKAAAGFELVKDDNTYTVRKTSIAGFISNTTGKDENDGLTDVTPKQNQGAVDGIGLRNLMYGGGTIVICGDMNISANETWDYGGAVTVTGSYNGKNYKDQDANTGIFKLHDNKTLTLGCDLTLDDLLFRAGTNSVIRVPNGMTLTITDSVQMLTDTLTIIVEEGGTANIASGKYAAIKGEGAITVTHCAHASVTVGVETAMPTCVQCGIRYDRCRSCGLYIGVSQADMPIDPDAHNISWTFGEDAAVATCMNGCGYSATQAYTPVTEIHVSSAGAPHGNLTAASPIDDFGAAMAIAAAQDTDVIVYIHDYAVIPENGGHSSWNVYIEPEHTNTITISGYKDLPVLRFNNDREADILLYALSGPTTFKNLELSIWGSEQSLYIVARHNKLVLAEGMSSDVFHKGDLGINLVGGCYRNDLSPVGGCDGLDTDITVLSGNYNNIYAGAWYNGSCCVDSNANGGDVHFTVGGNVSVSRQIRVGNQGDSSVYANMNDVYIDIVGTVTSLRYFVFGPSNTSYRAQNIYLRLYDGEVRVGDELPNFPEFGYVWGSSATGVALTAGVAQKLYVYGNSASVPAMNMYGILLAELSIDPANTGKWEAFVMDETYCDVNRGAHTPAGAAIGHLDATCVAEGYDLYTCTACGETYSVKIDRVPHTYGEAITIAATCIAPEMQKEVCTECGSANYTVTGSVYAAHTDPEKTGRCRVCNKDLTADCAHVYGTPENISSGCGTGTRKTCTLCGKVEVDLQSDAHNYGAYTVTVAPTASAPGMKVRTCKSCGKAETALIYSQNTTSATAMAVDATGKLADFSVENTKLSKAEKAVLNALLQQSAYGSEVKIAYETEGDVIKNVVYMIPVPAEYTDYENIRVAVREENGELQYVHFEIEKGYIVFVF